MLYPKDQLFINPDKTYNHEKTFDYYADVGNRSSRDWTEYAC